MSFSERYGLSPAKVMQLDDIDKDLRNGIWNALSIYILDEIKQYVFIQGLTYEPLKTFTTVLWVHFYKLPVDEMPKNRTSLIKEVKFKYSIARWYKIYDLLEFILKLEENVHYLDLTTFKSFCNALLEREKSGYRIVGNQISKVTNSKEIEEIEGALSNTTHLTSFQGANTHLNAALALLSNKQTPDYRNSIKESILAVESVAKAITGDPKATLGSALKTLKDKINLHAALQKGYENLYGYTSDGSGIRHGLSEESSCDFEDAKYMLVSCSAFINYLIPKAQKAQINLK